MKDRRIQLGEWCIDWRFKYAWIWRFLITWGNHSRNGKGKSFSIGFYDKDCEENIWQVGG